MLRGRSIFQQLSNSSFGTFRKVLEGLDGVDMKDFNLPEVIVIGAESSGKSSLLEAITKCPVFPRNRSMCTRMPIRLKLTNANSGAGEDEVTITYGNERHVNLTTDGILELVESIMNQLPSDEISDTELVIDIKQPNIPTFTFIDLPGIRSFPAQLARDTVDMRSPCANSAINSSPGPWDDSRQGKGRTDSGCSDHDGQSQHRELP